MKQERDVTVILDRSGSMQSIASDAIGGFNDFLVESAAAGRLPCIAHPAQRDVFQWSFLFLAANQDAIAEGAEGGHRRSAEPEALDQGLACVQQLEACRTRSLRFDAAARQSCRRPPQRSSRYIELIQQSDIKSRLTDA